MSVMALAEKRLLAHFIEVLDRLMEESRMTEPAIEIPEGILLPYRPEVKVGDEVLILQLDGNGQPVGGTGQTFTVSAVRPQGYPQLSGWGPLCLTADSWAIVNGPVEKGDWVIILEWWAPNREPVGHLGQVDHLDKEGDVFLTPETAYRHDGAWHVVSKWAKVELAPKPEPTPAYKVGDRVEVFGYKPDQYPGWNGPGTVRVTWPDRPHIVNVEMDNPTGSGFQSAAFEVKYLRPLKAQGRTRVQNYIDQTRPKLSELKLGAVIRDNSDGSVWFYGSRKDYEGDPFSGPLPTDPRVVACWYGTDGRQPTGKLIDDYTVEFPGVEEAA